MLRSFFFSTFKDVKFTVALIPAVVVMIEFYLTFSEHPFLIIVRCEIPLRKITVIYKNHLRCHDRYLRPNHIELTLRFF